MNGISLYDTNGFTDIYVRYTDTKEIERVSIGNDGFQPNANTYRQAVSANGRRVAYDSPVTTIRRDLNPPPGVPILDNGNSPSAHRALRTRCTGGGSHDVYAYRKVTNGWVYTFRVMKAYVCYYNSNGDKIQTCSEKAASAISPLSTSWKELSFNTEAPSGAVKAKILLRTYSSTGDGSAYWDVVGFYARYPAN